MSEDLYYAKYEQRYQTVHAAGGTWGFTPENEDLIAVLTQWVRDNGLEGKRIIEFACGEGAAGKILTDLGCIYHGVDLAPSAVEKASALLKNCPNATVSQLDMVQECLPGPYDAALDVMGFHILLTDQDRGQYLRNIYRCLTSGAPVLFFRQAFWEDAYEGPVESFDQWAELMNIDYSKAESRYAKKGDGAVEVLLPRIAGRGRSEAGYRREFTAAGFVVERFEREHESPANRASIWALKP